MEVYRQGYVQHLEIIDFNHDGMDVAARRSVLEEVELGRVQTSHLFSRLLTLPGQATNYNSVVHEVEGSNVF